MRRLTAIAVLVVSSVAGLRAQATHASLTGRVNDPSKAAIAAVRVVAINDATSARHQTTTDMSGGYHLAGLPPGSYQIEVEKSGFKKVVKPDVVVHVQDALTLDFEMTLGSLSESITVEAGAPLIHTRSAAVGTVVDRRFVENLPLNGRSFQSLIAMTPGVTLTPATSTSPGQFSVNGQRSDANYFMVDGVSANVGVQPGTALGVAGTGAVPALSAQGATNSLVSVDAMQEFRIETSTYAPEFGRMPGGQISIVTRSGTNQFHGSLFEYFRDDAFDSRDYFVTRQRLPKPKERQHDFGGTVGGPLAANQTFVFVSYEGLRLEQPRSAVLEVPSLASRAAASDTLRPIFAAFPMPNGPETGRGFAQFAASYADPSTLDATSVRLDQRVGTSLTVFGRYNYAPSDAASRLGSFGIAGANTIGTLQHRLHTLTTGAAWMIRPSVSNDLRVNWSRNIGRNFQMLDDFGGAVVPPAEMMHPAFAPGQSAYQLNLGAANVLFADGLNADNVQRQINIVNALVLTKGSHQAKVGVDYRRFIPIYGPLSYAHLYTFNGVAGAQAGTVSVNVSGFSRANALAHATNLSVFAQDTWSAARKLTLSYGMRWEVNPAPGLRNSNDALTLTSADAASLGVAPPGTAMYRTTFGNLAPRLGAAYRLRDATVRETVIRGGWGIFFDMGSNSVIDNLSTSFPFVARRMLVNVPFPVTAAQLTPPTIAPGAVVDFLVAADPELELPYTHQWNIAVEQALSATSTVSLSYVGAVGHRLLRQERLLNPTPQFGQVTLVTNHGRSRYHAMQAKYTRRLSSGLHALVSYTLADSMDNTSSDVIPMLPAFRVDPDEDWGPSDFDVRHTFSGGVTYMIPSLARGSAWRRLTSGWSIDGVFIARSALPVNVLTGTTAFGVANALRPDVVPGVDVYVDDDAVPGGWRVNRAAFAAPPLDAAGNPLRQGTLPRNALRGFAMSQLDLAIRRDIPLGGRTNLQLRVEAFNVFDQASFGAPTNTLTSGLFGQSTRTLASSLGAGGVAGGGFSPLYQVGGPRSLQLAMKFQF